MTFFPCKRVKMLPKSACFFPVMSSLSANTHQTLDSKWHSSILTIWRNCPPHLPCQQRRRQWHGSCAALWSDPPGIPSCPAGSPSCGRPSSPSCRPPGSTAASLLSVSRFSHLLWGRCGGPCNTRRLGRKVGWCWRWWWWWWQLILSMHSWRAQIHTVWKCSDVLCLPGIAWLQLFVQPTWTTNVSITIHQDTYSKLHHHYKCYKNFHHHEETFSPAPTPPSQPRRGGRHRCPNTSTSILTWLSGRYQHPHLTLCKATTNSEHHCDLKLTKSRPRKN